MRLLDVSIEKQDISIKIRTMFITNWNLEIGY